MIAGSLFSGIEGFGLGLLWSGLIDSIAWQVEIDPFCRRVLDVRFPNTDRSCTDVRTASASNLAAVDVMFGGFPCQDISVAGNGAGLDGARSGLWFEFARLIGELRPRIVLVKNVAALLGRGLHRVLGDLAAVGYDAQWRIISAAECGAPHERERVFILGHMPSKRRRRERGETCRKGNAGGASRAGDGIGTMSCIKSTMVPRPDGLPSRVARWPSRPGEAQYDWEPPRTTKEAKERAAKLKAIGNAVSPIQAYHVGLWAREVLGI
jgi:DNA (cytosine-5)-methyltransferase 1